MAGNKTGGLRAAAENKRLYGDDYYKRIGQQGGSVKGVKKGFAAVTYEQRAAAGKKGGLISRIRRKVV